MAMPAPMEAPKKSGPSVGGHIGVATPFVAFHSKGKGTTSFSDTTTIAIPVGVSVHLSSDWTFDFETVVGNNVAGDSTKAANGGNTSTGLTVDPGIVYTGGPVALGLRVKWDINSKAANVGLIPLINFGLVKFDGGVWFIEAAFPATLSDAGDSSAFDFAVVAHTGIGF
jgi:hypothetical protein